MKEKLKLLKQSQINDIRYKGKDKGLLYKKYGRFNNINDYSDQEISEMHYGIYKDNGVIIVDGGYPIMFSDVSSIYCDLISASYYKKPSINDYKTNNHNRIGNIRTFYVRNYYLETEVKLYNTTKHSITRFLCKMRTIKQGRNNFRDLYSIANSSKNMQDFKRGQFPKDLYHPIKRYINGLFFNDDYHISDFRVESKINIHI